MQRLVLLVPALLTLTSCSDDADSSEPQRDGGTSDAVADASTGSVIAFDAGSDANVRAASDAAIRALPDAAAFPEPALPAPTVEQQRTSQFSQIYADILATRCASCHQGDHPSGLDMSSAAAAYANLVGIPAGSGQKDEGSRCAETGLLRVERFVPGASLLVRKLSIPPNVPCGAHMPLDAAPLSSDEQARIKLWISNGASER